MAGAAEGAARLANPPTEAQNALRTTIVPSLLDVARRNFNQRAPSVAIFELGKCFASNGSGELHSETLCLAALWAGGVSASPWQAAARDAGITYSRFIEGLKAAKVEVNRKVLADLAAPDSAAFGELVSTAKSALKAKG